jgi:hypothetical protein
MSTETKITLFEGSGSLMTNFDQLANDLAEVVHETPSSGGPPLLRMQKDGEWIIGASNDPVSPNSLWAVNPLSVQRGYAAWTKLDPPAKNTLLDERMAPLGQPKPRRHELPDMSAPGAPAPWVEQIIVQLRCIAGEEEGLQVVYKVTSKGGLDALSDLSDAMSQRFREAKQNGAQVVPVVQLGCSSYPHPSYGKTYTPVLDVIAWMGFDGKLPSNLVAKASPPPAPTMTAQTAAILSRSTPRAATRTRASSQAENEPPPWVGNQDPPKAESDTPWAEPSPRIRRRRVE